MAKLAVQYGMFKLISTILKHKGAIETADVVKEVKAVKEQSYQIIERLLLMWINEKQLETFFLVHLFTYAVL